MEVDQTAMNNLLEALKKDDEDEVAGLACELFITNEGRCNWEAIKTFERFADCRIVPLEKDSFGWLVGGIRYDGKTYAYG